MEYRTKQQFEEILNTNHYGNLTKSYELAEEYGFFASDLREFYTSEYYSFDGSSEFYTPEYYWFDVTRLISIAEGAERIRNERSVDEEKK